MRDRIYDEMPDFLRPIVGSDPSVASVYPQSWEESRALPGYDYETLFNHCLRLAHEKEFFIRKAIGWTLREYAKTRPDRVRPPSAHRVTV